MSNAMIPDKSQAAVCGLYCPSCVSFIATKENPESLRQRAESMGRPVDDLMCHGCRSDKLSFYCKELCSMKSCAAEKSVEFCGDCTDYPCDKLKDFQKQLPHRLELWSSLDRIKEAGYETWFKEMTEHYSCPNCNAMNSAYDMKCKKCGAEPGSKFSEVHKDALAEYVKKKNG